MTGPISLNTLWMIGAGQMGQALYHGWCASDLPIAQMVLIDPTQSSDKIGLRKQDMVLAQPDENTPSPDVILFAIKPQMANDVLPLYRDYMRDDTLILSIMAGIGMDKMQSLFDKTQQPIIRTMPNTPAMVGQGMTGAAANASVTKTQRAIADQLLQSVGKVAWLEREDDLHAVTALSGSGPAYIFALIETMAAAGEQAGLSPELAAQLARQTVIGSAALAASQSDITPEQLRRNVTSPGGTTAAGLDVLLAAEGGLPALMRETIKAAARRSRELAQ
ncbi:MAG TPA: pyrroline-5-carboxylate reductase [Alphaproteobacteria bacterium]